MQLHHLITAAVATATLVFVSAGCLQQTASDGATSTHLAPADAPAAAVETTASGVVEATVTYAGETG